MALVSRSTVRLPVALGSAALPMRPVRVVLVRAEPGAKVTREFREDTGEVSTPAASSTTRQQADGLYVNDDGPRPVPRKSNLSKEMKAKLRAEYTGLGGAENKDASDFAVVPSPSPRMPIIIAAASVEMMEAPTAAAAAAAFTGRPDGATVSDAHASTSAAAAPKVGASKFVVDENENLKSTPEQRAWTWVSIALIAATFAEGTKQVNGVEDAVVFGAAVFLAYVMSDLGTGIYHWGVDNYGDGSTPVFGRQIAAFQGHHQRPWTIAQREFANNMHQVFGPASYPAAGLLVLSPVMPVGWNAWASSFLFLVCMSQQFHAWSHMKKSELAAPIVALQDAGVLISRRMHGAHHRSPFEGNYCIVSGLWNPLLDNSEFFRKAEKAIHEYTGVAPRCWEEAQEGWQELERPEMARPASSSS